MDKRSGVRQHYQNEAESALHAKQYSDRTVQLNDFEGTVVDGFNALIKFIDGKTTKTEVVNQLRSISTPDVDKLIPLLSKLDKGIQSSKVDLKPLVAQLTAINRQVSLLPKTHPEKPEPTESVKVTNLSELKLDTSAIEKAINKLKLDPVVDVKSPIVNVDAPDLAPLQDLLKKIVTAVKDQKYPKFPEIPVTDLTKVEKKLDESNKHLKAIVDKPVGGGGGGGGNATPYVDSTGKPVNVVLNSNGSIPTSSSTTNYTTRIAEDSGDSNLTYIGKAAIGSATSSAVWQIQKIDETTGMVITWAQTGLFTAKWDDRTTETYT